jgi:hypothetical protein
MNQSWPIRLLDQLELVDAQEAPHGLYGIRRAYAPEGPLPSAAHVLGSPRMAGLLQKCRFSGRSPKPGSDVLSFTAGSESVSLQILDYATTKVRHFGSAFRLDKHPGRQPREPRWDLESRVPKLRRGWYGTSGILLIAHTVSARETEGLLGKTADPAFLDRYVLTHHIREWDDRYARGFRTALHLWVPRMDDAEPGAASDDVPTTAQKHPADTGVDG